MTEEPQKRVDGEKPKPRVELLISPDKMVATLYLRGRPNPDFDYDSVLSLINDHGIKYGLQESELHRILEDYRTATAPVELEAVVAKGIPVVPGENGRIEILVESGPIVSIGQDGRADYRNVERFRTVDKDQVVARIYPPKEGTPGVSILGEQVPPRPVRAVDIQTGPNVSNIPNTVDYIARIHGVFVYNKRILDVSAVLDISGNVGIESGNVNYDGSVNIQGAIDRGSEVVVGGDISVGGAVESGNLHAGGSLTVKKGINTKRDGRIEVGGGLKAVYVDNSAIMVDGDISVEKSIVASKIICHGNVYLSGRGSAISGGEVTAYGSITADSIGNRTETPTKVVLGEHFRNQELLDYHLGAMENLVKEYEKVADEILRIKTFVQRKRGAVPVEKKAEFRIVFQQYKEMKDKLHIEKKRIEFYKKNRFNPEAVKLTVRDILYPGTEIHYRTYVEKVKAPLTKVVLRFAPRMEKPEMEAYNPGPL